MGICLLMYKAVKFRGKNISMVTGYMMTVVLAGGVPTIYAVLSRTPLYNGWRHFYFIYATIILLSGWLISKLWLFLVKRKRYLRVFPVVLIGELLLLSIGIVCNYPQEYSYYNILAGKNVENRWELDYWELSTREAFHIIMDDMGETNDIVNVSAPDVITLWGVEG